MRNRTAAVALVAIVVSIAPSLPRGQTQSLIPLFNSRNLDGWEIWNARSYAAQFVAADGVLRVTGGSGWLLTTRPYGDFVLTFRARQRGKDSVGGVLVRVFRHFKAYELQVASGRNPTPLFLETADSRSVPVTTGRMNLFRADEKWHDYRVECQGDRVRVWRDGQETVALGGLPLNSGRIGLHGWRGTVEFRDIALREMSGSTAQIGEGFLRCYGRDGKPSAAAPLPCDNVLETAPRVTREIRVRFPPQAQPTPVEGEILLECVVDVDGCADWCGVVRGMSPELDAAVLAAAKQCMFVPGTRNGRPVRAVVSLSVGLRWPDGP